MTNFSPDYLPLGAFFAPPLAGAAFCVEAAAGVSSPDVPFLPPAAFLAFSPPAAFSLLGAGFSVGVPAMSLERC